MINAVIIMWRIQRINEFTYPIQLTKNFAEIKQRDRETF